MPSLFASYLRVYEPLTAFDRERQVFWRRYVREGRAVAPLEGPVPPAHGGDRGAGRRLDAAARPARRGVRAGGRRHPAGLPVEPAAAGRRGGAQRPRRRAVGDRRRVRAAGARRARPSAVVDDWRSGARVLEHGVPRVHEQIATWGVPLRWFVFVDLGERDLVIADGAAVAALPHGDLQGPAPRVRGRCRCCASRWATRRSPRRSRRAPGGWRSSTRARWSSSTTAAWSTCSPTTDLADDDSPGLVAAGLAALSRGDADAATEAYEKLVARWRAVQLLDAD